MLPAVGQGRSPSSAAAETTDCGVSSRRSTIRGSAACVGAERAMLAALDGSCRTPIAGLAELDGDRLTLEGCCSSPTAAPRSAPGRPAASATRQALGTELGGEEAAPPRRSRVRDLDGDNRLRSTAGGGVERLTPCHRHCAPVLSAASRN